MMGRVRGVRGVRVRRRGIRSGGLGRRLVVPFFFFFLIFSFFFLFLFFPGYSVFWFGVLGFCVFFFHLFCFGLFLGPGVLLLG